MKHRVLAAALFLLAAVAPLENRASAQETGVRLGLSYPRGTNPTVVVMPVESSPADSVRTILERDFDFSDRIRPLVLDIVTLQGLTPRRAGEYNYALFARFGAAAIVQPTRTATGIRVGLYDVAAKKLVQSAEFPMPRISSPRLTEQREMAPAAGEGNLRMAIHGIADEVERWITGKRGIAQTRVAYVHDGKVRVVDSDGANDVAVTHSGLSLSPSWSADATSLVYSTLNDRGSQIAMLNVNTGQQSILAAASSGVNITPVFSPDGRAIVYATGSDQGTNLVRADIATGSITSLTVANNRGDNASPTFSPDGRRIAFLSSRARYPQIYAMDTDGSNVELITPYNPSVRSYRTAPEWSPDGRSIAYEQQNGDFQVWVINIRDKEMRRLTSLGENEGPTWAPDGRHIAISSTRSGSKQIWILDTLSGRFRQLTRNPGGRLAAWSPLVRVAP